MIGLIAGQTGRPGGSLRTIFSLAPVEFALFGLYLLAVTAGLVWAWVSWKRQESRSRGARWRGLCHLAALAAASLAMVAFIGAVAHAAVIGGFSRAPGALILWVRFGLWLSVAAALAASLGRGPRRGVLVACSAALILVWVGMAMAP